jgi:hypothetical protein
MANVTRDRKKYGAPTVFTEQTRLKKERQDREEEMFRQRERDMASGRREAWNGRALPVLDQDEK